MLLDARPLMRASSARSRRLCSSVYISEGASLSSPLHAVPSSSAYVLSQQPSRNLTTSICSTESTGKRKINRTAASSKDNDRNSSSKGEACTSSIWFTSAWCGGGAGGGLLGPTLYPPHMERCGPVPIASPKSWRLWIKRGIDAQGALVDNVALEERTGDWSFHPCVCVQRVIIYVRSAWSSPYSSGSLAGWWRCVGPASALSGPLPPPRLPPEAAGPAQLTNADDPRSSLSPPRDPPPPVRAQH